jgi:hypothetical protein
MPLRNGIALYPASYSCVIGEYSRVSLELRRDASQLRHRSASEAMRYGLPTRCGLVGLRRSLRHTEVD